MATPEWVGKGLTCTIKGNGEVVEGEVYTYDKVTDTLVIKDHAVGLQEANYRFLKGNAIDPASVKLTGASRVPDATPPVATSTVERLRAKEKEKVFKEMQKEKNIGEGVSEFAQKVFNGLAKTMHCYWDGTDIVIKMGSSAEDEVRIKDPYEVAEGKNSSMVERVKLVLKGETERIRQ